MIKKFISILKEFPYKIITFKAHLTEMKLKVLDKSY